MKIIEKNNQKLKTEQKMIKKILEMNSYCAEQPYDWWNNRENRTHMINRDACNTADTNKIQIDELLFPPYRFFFFSLSRKHQGQKLHSFYNPTLVHDAAISAFLSSKSFSSLCKPSSFVNFSNCSGFISSFAVFCS